MDSEVIKLHKRLHGKIEIKVKEHITPNNLPLLYTPGVAEPCKIIGRDEDTLYDLTWKESTILIVTDGSAVLGLGDIGPKSALPVMEGKSVLFKEFGGINAVPICLATKDVDEIVRTVQLIAPAYGGINLEDISAPRCFEIEQRLIDSLEIPVFHDDQHGTAIVVAAGIRNALRLRGSDLQSSKIVINGAGAAGIAITKFLLRLGAGNIILCDRSGTLYPARQSNMNIAKQEISELTNSMQIKGDLSAAMKGADIFIGVSGPKLVSGKMVGSMAKNPIIFSLANPVPEISWESAKNAGASILAAGSSNYPNQINNLLVFPGIFKAALKFRLKKITFDIKKAAYEAIADMISPSELTNEYFIPAATNRNIADRIVENIRRKIVPDLM